MLTSRQSPSMKWPDTGYLQLGKYNNSLGGEVDRATDVTTVRHSVVVRLLIPPFVRRQAVMVPRALAFKRHI